MIAQASLLFSPILAPALYLLTIFYTIPISDSIYHILWIQMFWRAFSRL